MPELGVYQFRAKKIILWSLVYVLCEYNTNAGGIKMPDLAAEVLIGPLPNISASNINYPFAAHEYNETTNGDDVDGSQDTTWPSYLGGDANQSA